MWGGGRLLFEGPDMNLGFTLRLDRSLVLNYVERDGASNQTPQHEAIWGVAPIDRMQPPPPG